MRKTVMLAILVATAAATGFAQSGQSGAPSAQSGAQDPPSRIARLNYMSGSVSFRPGTVDEWTPATLNYPIYNGDRLWADRGARAELHVGSTALRMDSETAMAVLNLDDRMVQLSLTGGTLEIRLRSLGDGESFEVDTPNAAVTLLRAGEYRFFVDDTGNATTVTVRTGDAEVTSSGQAFTVHARESARLSGADDNFGSEVNGATRPDDFELWAQTRDAREEQSQSVRHVSREMIGYEDLDANGAWSEVPDYGWVWAPRVHAGWAPYHDGRWAWVDPWGWTWVDEAPWGFAPFHYGRWANYRGGWVWVPGTVVARPVYAPALVAFVGGPRFSLSIGIGGGGAGVAWFPLGPHEVYRPAYRVSEVYVRQVNVTHVHVTNINITNANNVTYVNQRVQGSVTAVSQSAFVSARPVRQSAIVVNANVMSQAQVVGAAPVAPERASVLGRPQASPGAAPPARFADRAVVARTPPPPPPVSFGARREAMAANPGRPLDTRTVETLRSNDRGIRAPLIRPAIGRPDMVRPATPAGAPAQPMTQPAPPAVRQQQQPAVIRDNAPVRPGDRPVRPPQQQNNDQPRRDQRVQEPQAAQPMTQPAPAPAQPAVGQQQQPAVIRDNAPVRPADRPVRPPQQQNNDQPRRDQRVREPQAQPARPIDHPTDRPTDRPMDRPRPQQNVAQPRTEPKAERTETRQAKKGEAKKEQKRDERKQQ